MADNPKYPRGQALRAPHDDEVEIAKQARNGPGLPYLSADALADLESRMRQRLLYLASGVIVLLVVFLGAGFYFLNQAGRRTELAAVPARAADKQNQPAPNLEAPGGAGGEMRSVAILPLTGAARERTLEALGGLTGTHLYQSYLNIGMLHDAAAEDVYTAAEARDLLVTILSLMDTVDQQLGRLPEAVLDPEDAKRLARIRQVIGHLRVQAKELRATWDTPEADEAVRKEHDARFQKSRQAAWAGIKELLDISN